MWDQRAGRAAGAVGAMRGDPYMGPMMGPGGMDPERAMAMLSPRDVVRALERVRRHRLVQIVSLGVLVPALLLVPGAFSDKGLDLPTLIGVLAALFGAGLAFVLNRFNLVSTASYVLIVGLLAAVAWDIASKPLSQTGLDLNDLRLYGFFVLPVLLSGVLTGRRGPFIIAGIAIAFTVASLLLLPRTATLQAYWDGRYQYAPGMSYDVVALPVAILILTGVAAWLGADSVQRALLGASRADALAAANERILAQAREIELARRRLQDGIGHMQYVHNAFARGQYDARARVPEGELLPLALSLNQLLDRLQRLAREQDQRLRMEQGVHELATALKRMRAGEVYVPPDYTGTPLDEVLVEMATLRPPAPAGPSRPFAAPGPYGAQPARPGAMQRPYGAPDPFADAAAFPPSPPSRAPGWASASPGGLTGGVPDAPASTPYRPDTAPNAAGAASDAPPADARPDFGDPAGPAGTLDPRELLPDWLQRE